MKNILIILFAVGAVHYFIFGHGSRVSHEPGVQVAEPPLQEMIASPVPFDHDGYTITPLAYFELKAKVLAKEYYRFDPGAGVSPVDLALGWGVMSDQSLIDMLSISQGARWYHWRYSDPLPVPMKEIIASSSNMHLIPADSFVKDDIDRAREGEIIHLRGKLVKVSGSNGFKWKSSLKRTDTGDGACELIFVESFQVLY